ncbi:MAG: hypothetical protein HFG73_03885 [Hungatella sp.]|nr:hypothetical protein [Hungatella sp.]
MSERNEKKAKGQNVAEREKLGIEFEEKYSDFLTALRQMPKGTEEEKNRRWAYFRSYPSCESIKVDLIEAYKPGAIAKYEARINKYKYETLDPDLDMAVFKDKRMFDNLVFMETVREAICNFTGFRRDGSSYGFLACIGMIYKQKAGWAAANEELGRRGISDSELPKKNLLSITKLAKAVTDICAIDSGKGSPEEVLDGLLKESKARFTKKELELVRCLIFDKGILSMEAHYEDEDGNDGSLMDKIADTKADIEANMEGMPFLETFCRHLEDGWEAVAVGLKLREKEYIRIFLTKNVLSVLKLDGNQKPYPKEPAGNKEIYDSLQACGNTLYEKVFYEKYLWRAFVERPVDFRGVYVKLLRKDFDFSDKLVGQVLGKDKTAVSKGKKKYWDIMEAFYEYYRESV